MTMNCFMPERTAILLYHFLRQQDDHINLGIHLQNSNGQTNVIEISLSSEGVVYAYPQGFVRKAHGNKFDECKGLQSVLFVRTHCSNMGSNGHPNGVLLESRRIFSV